MSKSQVDIAVRQLMVFARLFTKSWGTPQSLKSLKQILDSHLSKQLTMELVERYNPKMVITKASLTRKRKGNERRDCRSTWKGGIGTWRGASCPRWPATSRTSSPADNTKWCHWKGLFSTRERRGLALHLAATGDHGYRIRAANANELLKHGISSLLLQNPFYGSRKPAAQFRSALENVSDLFVLGASLAFECATLIRWFGEDYGPRVITGISMGGYNAGFAASNLPFRVGLVPCLSWTTAASRLRAGEPSRWKQLERELENPAFIAGISEIKSDWLPQLHDREREWEVGLDTPAKKFLLDSDGTTNLKQFPVPFDPSLTKFVVAEGDAYIERTGAPDIRDLWPGCEVHSIPGVGHVLGYFQHGRTFCRVIREVLERAEEGSS
ncbi:C4orf29-like protein [Aphelenchoides fujianensis]|nr:C4orf29-like protein [Aphelenchoides fujianensis]